MPAAKRILIVGTGSIGERHVRCFQKTGRARISICESNQEIRQLVASRYQVAESFADLDPALQAGHDAAVIATPAHLHVDQAVRAMEANLDVLVEKPLSVNLHGVPSLLMKKGRRILAVAYVWRHYPMLAAMQKALQQARFGRVLHFVASAGQHFPTYRPAYQQIYYAHHDQGGGAIQDALTHLLNAGQWLLGPINRVVVDAAHRALEGVTVEDTVNVLARHGDVPATYSLNQHQAPNEITLTAACEHGTARVEFHHRRWGWMTTPDADWNWESWPNMERDDAFTTQAGEFLDVIENRGEATCPLEDAILTLKATLAVLASSRETSAWKTLHSITDANV